MNKIISWLVAAGAMMVFATAVVCYVLISQKNTRVPTIVQDATTKSAIQSSKDVLPTTTDQRQPLAGTSSSSTYDEITIQFAEKADCPRGVDEILIKEHIQPTDPVQCSPMNPQVNLSGKPLRAYRVVYGHSGGKKEGDDVVRTKQIVMIALPSGKLIIDNGLVSIAKPITDAAKSYVSIFEQTTGTMIPTDRFVTLKNMVNGSEVQGEFCATFEATLPSRGTITVCKSVVGPVKVTGELTHSTGVYPFTDASQKAKVHADAVFSESGIDPNQSTTTLIDWAYRPQDKGYWLFSFYQLQNKIPILTTPIYQTFVIVRVENTGEVCVARKTSFSDERANLVSGKFPCN